MGLELLVPIWWCCLREGGASLREVGCLAWYQLPAHHRDSGAYPQVPESQPLAATPSAHLTCHEGLCSHAMSQIKPFLLSSFFLLCIYNKYGREDEPCLHSCPVLCRDCLGLTQATRAKDTVSWRGSPSLKGPSFHFPGCTDSSATGTLASDCSPISSKRQGSHQRSVAPMVWHGALQDTDAQIF